jgi:hypothetical protein
MIIYKIPAIKSGHSLLNTVLAAADNTIYEKAQRMIEDFEDAMRIAACVFWDGKMVGVPTVLPVIDGVAVVPAFVWQSADASFIASPVPMPFEGGIVCTRNSNGRYQIEDGHEI